MTDPKGPESEDNTYKASIKTQRVPPALSEPRMIKGVWWYPDEPWNMESKYTEPGYALVRWVPTMSDGKADLARRTDLTEWIKNN